MAGTITLEPGTPILKEANLPGEVIAVTTSTTMLKKGTEQLFLIKSHPLARYYQLSEVQLPDGRTGYTHTNLMFHPDGRIESGNMLEFWRIPLAVLLGGALAALVAILYKKRESEDQWRYLELGLIPVLLRMFCLILLLNQAQNIIASPADENGYYANLLDILNWDFSGQWHFTVGTSLFYLPFEFLWGSGNLIDLLIPLSWFEGFVIAPFSLYLGYLIGRKLLNSETKACIAMLGWAILPFIWHHVPDFPNKFFTVFGGLPSSEFSYSHYITLIGCGFSAMSDTPSTMLMLSCFALLLCAKASWRTVTAAAFLFGVGCMFRINNILFAPAIAAIILLQRPEYFAGVKKTVHLTLIGAGAFLLGFLPQIVANWHFFGNPLKFSYTNYAQGAHTYIDWIFVELNSAFYGAVNSLLWIPGILALFFIRDRKLRLTLALWTIPVILFFFGYSHGTDDPVRFILSSYPAFFIAITGCGVWDKLKKRDFLWLLPIFAGLFACTPNSVHGSYHWYFSAPYRLFWREGGFTYLAATGVVAIVVGVVALYKKNRHCGIFLGISALLYLFGNAYILAVGLVTALVYALFDTLKGTSK
ncbi:MAG: hypothetical protein LBM70_07115 [Victivallales bacterium]|nr:hypothetical protein [Victivallales bacterium]